MGAVELHTVTVRAAPVRRLSQLTAGLVLYGVSTVLLLKAGLGLSPWDVLHQGVASLTGWTLGAVTGAVSAAVLLLWIPLRQRPGIGTLANAVVVAVVVDLARTVLPAPDGTAARAVLLVSGVALNAVATAAYVGVRLGPGARDGLMTGLSARTGWSVRAVRTCVEATVLLTGWLLGGTAGVGTVLYALAIGPLTQLVLPLVVCPAPGRPGKPRPAAVPSDSGCGGVSGRRARRRGRDRGRSSSG